MGKQNDNYIYYTPTFKENTLYDDLIKQPRATK